MWKFLNHVNGTRDAHANLATTSPESPEDPNNNEKEPPNQGPLFANIVSQPESPFRLVKRNSIAQGNY